MSGYDASSPPAGSRRSGGTCEPAHETSTVKAPDPNRSRELRVLQRARFSRREDLKAEMQIVFDTPTRRSKPTKRRLPAVIEPERSSKRPRRPSREEQLAEMAPFHPGSAAAAAHAPADPITLAQRAAAAVTPFYWVVAAECAQLLGYGARNVAEFEADVKKERRTSSNADRWIGHTNLYREKIGRDHTWMYWIAPPEQHDGMPHTDAVTQTPAMKQMELVNEVLHMSNHNALSELLESGVTTAVMSEATQALVLRCYGKIFAVAGSQRPWAADDFLDVLGVCEEDVVNINDFGEALADYLQKIERPVLRPRHLKLYGKTLGTIDRELAKAMGHKSGAADVLALLAKGTKEYRESFTKPSYIRTPDSMMGRVDIEAWWASLSPTVRLTIDAGAELIGGVELELAASTVLEGGEYTSRVPAVVGLEAADRLVVGRLDMSYGADNPWEGKSAYPRPPLMRAKGDIDDSGAFGSMKAQINHAQRAQPTAQTMWACSNDVGSPAADRHSSREDAAGKGR